MTRARCTSSASRTCSTSSRKPIPECPLPAMAMLKTPSPASRLLQGRVSGLEGFDAFGGAQQQYIGWTRGEQTVGDHADDRVDLSFQLHRISDLHVEHVED